MYFSIKKITLFISAIPFLFLFVFVGCSSSSASAKSKNEKGHILEKIGLKNSGTYDYLSIEGTFNQENLSGITLNVDSKKTTQEFTLSITGAVIDPEKLKEQVLRFPQSDLLEQVRIVEDIQEKSEEDLLFIVKLVVKTSKKVTVEIVRPIKVEEGIKLKILPFKPKPKSEPKPEPKQSDIDTSNLIVKPEKLRLSIFNGTGLPYKANKLSVFLGSWRKNSIEKELGLRFEIVNISNAPDSFVGTTTIFYSEHYLKSALYLARIIPGSQKLVRMNPQEETSGVDIKVFLGKDYK